jgi:hypothetical protein
VKNFILLLAVVVLMSLSFAFSFSNTEEKPDSKSKCPYLQQQSQSVCPYSGKSLDRKSENKSDGNCPYLNNGSDKNTSPYLEGMKSSNSNNKNIPQIWQEIKS